MNFKRMEGLTDIPSRGKMRARRNNHRAVVAKKNEDPQWLHISNITTSTGNPND